MPRNKLPATVSSAWQSLENERNFSLLLVEPDVSEARRIQLALTAQDERTELTCQVVWTTSIPHAIGRLKFERFGVVLLDLETPEAGDPGALAQLIELAAPGLVLLICSLSDEERARAMLRAGAYDYLPRSQLDTVWLPRAMRYLAEYCAMRDALRESQACFHAVSEASQLGISISNAMGTCVYANEAYQTIAGQNAEAIQSRGWEAILHPDDRADATIEFSLIDGDMPFHTEARVLRRDGSIIWTRLNAAPMYVEGIYRGQVQTIEDISSRFNTERILRAAEDSLFEEKEHAQVTLNSIGDAVISTDLATLITYMNPAAEKVTGWRREEAIGRPLTEVFRLIDGSTREPGPNPAERAIAADKTISLAADYLLIRRDGFESAIEDSAAPIHNRDGKISGAVIVFHDVTEARAMAQKMVHLAQHDFLTGLPNRVLLTERLEQAIGLAQRHEKQVALLFIDLDYFKHINDSLGHAIGDQLLQSVATRLTGCVRNTDTVCRQGGDEFVILLSEIEQAQDAAWIAETLLNEFSAPHLISGHELHVPLSIGISVYPDDGKDASTILQNADAAMYHAKFSGRNNYQFFRAELNAGAAERLSMESGLRRALKQGEFVLHYQPKIDLRNKRMTGSEALIRWMNPEAGMTYPAQFIPIAEESGLIVPIGRWVLREACEQIQRWLHAGLPAVPVAINISAVEFRNKDFLHGVEKALLDTGLDASYLELELTESMLMHDVETSTSVLLALKEMGVRLAIDDFGTGYSSLSYLKRFPIDTLKIDQTFVQDIASDPDNATIVSAVIGMGRNLKQRVIAEGVETAGQLEFLLAQHCDEGQGFQFSHPLSADDFTSWLQNTEPMAGAADA